MGLHDKDVPQHAMLSHYNSHALRHGASIGGLIVAIFAYMGLSLKSTNITWGYGSLVVLLILCSFTLYSCGRLAYFSILTELVMNERIENLILPTIRTVDNEIGELFAKERESQWYYQIGWRYRDSFRSIFPSLILGSLVGLLLWFLGFFIQKFG